MSTVEDYKSLSRTAQRTIVEYKAVLPRFGPTPVWIPIYEAKAISITHTAGMNFNTATIRFPAERWDIDPAGLKKGALIRILTATDLYKTQSVLFEGIYTRRHPAFSGGSDKGGAFDCNDIECLDYRWLLHTGTAIYGQFARGVDDYESDGAPKNQTTFMSAQRCVFNPGGRPNRDPNTVYDDGLDADIHVFCPPRQTLPDGSEPAYWTARQMLEYIFNPLLNPNANTFYYHLYNDGYGTEHADFDTVLSGVMIDGLSVIEAADLICRNLGWTFRQDGSEAGSWLVFYKIGTAADEGDTLLHELHAPAVGEHIAAAVAEGRFMCCDAEILDDIEAVVNNPVGIGAPEIYEFTAELVPAWQDSDMPVDADDAEFFTEADLMAMSTPNTLSFFNKYHTRGAAFLRNVGRKWALNETGAYTGGDYDRGDPFDFASVFPADRILDNASGKRLYGLYPRTFIDPLTFDAAGQLSAAPVKVEFSFDGGATWHEIDCVKDNLKGECAVRINEPNLSNIKLPGGDKISGGTLDGEELNYWTSLAADKLDGTNYTRVRVTASVQADQRLLYAAPPSNRIASPYTHRRLYDFSDRYTYQQRTASSEYSSSTSPAWNTDQTQQLIATLDEIRSASEDASISGRFTLDRLWLGDGKGRPTFMPGDQVSKLTGRDYEPKAVVNGADVYPEIIQIHYDIEHQKMHLITRDLRLEEVRF